jgi:hypothetical protein
VSSQTSGSLLLLAAIGIIIPTAAQRLGTTADEEAATAAVGMLAQGMAQDKARLCVVECMHSLLIQLSNGVALQPVCISYLACLLFVDVGQYFPCINKLECARASPEAPAAACMNPTANTAAFADPAAQPPHCSWVAGSVH